MTPVQPHKKTNTAAATATAEPMRMSEEEMNKRRANFRKRLEDALTEGKSVVNFPKGLNACERMLVHEVATSMSLAHESHGEGKKRFVCVRLKDEPGSESPDKGAALESAPTASSSSGAPPQVEASIPSFSQSEGPEQQQQRPSQHSAPQQQQRYDVQKNELLASLAAERQHRSEARNAEARNMEEQYAEHKKVTKSKSKKKKKGGAKEPDEGDASEEDLDALLHEFAQDDKKCYFLNCKQSVALIAECMRRCRFCSKQYCQEHVMAELHGCGEAVRAHERSKFKEMMTKHERGQGLVNPSCKDVEWKRKLIHDKLHGKIKGKESDRTAKKSQDK